MRSLRALAPVFTGPRKPIDPEVWSAIQGGTFLVGAILVCMGLVARMKQTAASDAGPPGSLWFVSGALMMGMAGLMYILS